MNFFLMLILAFSLSALKPITAEATDSFERESAVNNVPLNTQDMNSNFSSEDETLRWKCHEIRAYHLQLKDESVNLKGILEEFMNGYKSGLDIRDSINRMKKLANPLSEKLSYFMNDISVQNLAGYEPLRQECENSIKNANDLCEAALRAVVEACGCIVKRTDIQY